MFADIWSILCESAVYILFGFFIAGLLRLTIPTARIVRYLSGRRKRSVLYATLMGMPLPLCSCSVLPTALTLRRQGAGKGAVLSFLISTPETSVTSILLTYSLLGPLMAVFRPIAACITALVAGFIENAVDKRFRSTATEPEAPLPPTDTEGASPDECPDESCEHTHEICPEGGALGKRLYDAMRYAFVDLFDDIFGWVLVGIVAAALIHQWLAPDVLQSVLGGPFQSMLVMILIGIPLYVCAETSTPVAAVLIAAGINPGAALVLLLVGPATNIGSIGLLMRELGRRTMIIYLSTIGVVSMLMGGWLNSILADTSTPLYSRVLQEPLVPSWLKVAGAILFLMIGLGTIRRQRYVARAADKLSQSSGLRITERRLYVVALLLAAILYGASGFFEVRAGEVGIVRRFGAIQRQDLPPGLYYALPYPIDQVDRVQARRVHRLMLGYGRSGLGTGTASDDASAWSLVGDENLADIKMGVHWSADPDQLANYRFGVSNPERLVRVSTLAAAREVLAGLSINHVFTSDRLDAQRQIQQIVQRRLDANKSGIHIDSIAFLDAHAPPQVHQAFRDVASAVEDRSRQIHEARRDEAKTIPQARGKATETIEEAKGYAARTTAQARGDADRFLALLKAYHGAPAVTARRMEFETLEKVLPKLRKYIKPSAGDAGDLDFWFVSPSTAGPFANQPR